MFSAQGRAWIGLSALLAAVFMSILDVFITVSAAPTIRVDLGVGATGIQMILAAYNLSFGLLLVTGGRMGDIWGRKRIFLAGLSLFVVASLVASLAATTSLLITARLVQGAAAGLLMPQIFSVIQAIFEDGERGKAFGAFAVVSGIAATTAQLLGGLLLEINLFGLGWRIIFLINVPIGLAALVVAHALVPESRAPGSNHLTLDGVGVSLFALGLVSVTLPLTLGPRRGCRCGRGSASR
ncbi:MAG TPA: MFS transporter [Microvirga sp.]|nr:MFS transporter [Microvirga sp.]